MPWRLTTCINVAGPVVLGRCTHSSSSLSYGHLNVLSYQLLPRALVSIGKCMFLYYFFVRYQILSVVDEAASQI